MKNKEMTILKALGIMAVVFGHTPVRIGGSFESYSFHMALFFFISGYFYNKDYEVNVKYFLKKRVRTIVIPYFLYNLFYFIVTKFVYIIFKVDFGQKTTLSSFFIQPFINGHQYLLYLAAWFVLQLFIVQITYLLLSKCLRKIIQNQYILFGLFLILGLFGTFISTKIPMQNINLIIVRTLFGLFFFHLGSFYKNNLESKNIFRFSILVTIIIFQFYLKETKIDLTYELIWGKFNSGYILPFVTSITGIYLYLFISKGLARVVSDTDILIAIGSNTFHIMANHILIFFVVNIIFVKVYSLDPGQLQNIWFKHNIYQTWPIYISLGLLVPTYIAIFIRKLVNKIKDRKSTAIDQINIKEMTNHHTITKQL